MMIKKDRILKEFEELISIDSLSFAERDMADRLKEKLACLLYTSSAMLHG